VVERWPDHITISSNPDPVQATGGNWVMPTGVTTFASDCRFQPAGENNVIRGKDGDEITYDYRVYLPKTTEEFEFGDSATGVCENRSFEGTVKGHHNRQTYTIVWV
jgi:hypothetical protein